jgi:chromosomal replication initiator protein
VKDDIDQEVNVSWSSITSELKKSLDKDTFQNWIKPIHFETLLDTSLTLAVPHTLLKRLDNQKLCPGY